jgi:hypothetical protein
MDYNKKKQHKAKTETAEMKSLRSVASYTSYEQIRNTKIREELNIFNLNAKIIKSRSQWKYHVQQMEDRWIQKKILTHNPKRMPTVKMEGSAHSSRGWNRPCVA